MSKSNNLAILILAAGTSSRLGEPKQLVKFQNKTLIQNSIEKALEVSSNVTVVLGSNADLIIKEIIDYPISIVVNEEFEKGIGSSISYGISCTKEFDKTLLMLCDQPFINSSHLQNLINDSNYSNEIICSFYNNDVAVPAIFPKRFYKDLSALNTNKGAKAIIKKNIHKTVDLDDKLAFDVDTKEDKKALKNY